MGTWELTTDGNLLLPMFPTTAFSSAKPDGRHAMVKVESLWRSCVILGPLFDPHSTTETGTVRAGFIPVGQPLDSSGAGRIDMHWSFMFYNYL